MAERQNKLRQTPCVIYSRLMGMISWDKINFSLLALKVLRTELILVSEA